MVFLWFSYGFPIENGGFLWFSSWFSHGKPSFLQPITSLLITAERPSCSQRISSALVVAVSVLGPLLVVGKKLLKPPQAIFRMYIIYIYIYIYIHYITLHYITLNYIALHYIKWHFITYHYIPLHYTTLHYIHTCICIHIYIYII